MTWAKLDDRLHDDDRTLAAGVDAMGLWAIALSYMGDRLTDGEISVERVRRIAGRRGEALSTRLVDAGWWERTPTGFRLMSWQKYLISRSEVEANREHKSELGRRGGMAKAAKEKESGLAPRQAPASAEFLLPIPSRSRPDPRREEEPPVGPPPGTEQSFKLQPTGEPPPKRRKPETAIPDGWGPSAEHLTLGRSLGFDEARVRREGEKFVDWARSKDARYVDWHAAFCNRLRGERAFAEQRGEKIAPLPPPEKRPTGVRTIEFPRGRIIAAVEAQEAARKAAAAAAAPPEEPEDDTPEMSPEEFRALKDRRLAELRASDAEHGATDAR